MTTQMHMCLSVRGALKTMTKRQLAGMFNHDDGRAAAVPKPRGTMEALARTGLRMAV